MTTDLFIYLPSESLNYLSLCKEKKATLNLTDKIRSWSAPAPDDNRELALWILPTCTVASSIVLKPLATMPAAREAPIKRKHTNNLAKIAKALQSLSFFAY